ncbi:hypothetical protein DPV78_003339, partial [Talaromyces pinophilus]
TIVDLYQQQRNRLIFWTNSNFSVVDELCSDDFVQFYPMHGRLVGRNAVKGMMVGFKEVREYLGMKTFPYFGKAFPDLSFRLLSSFPLISEDDYVVARWFGGGKHTGLTVPNSGKEMQFSGTTIFKLKDNKIVEETGEESALVAMQQLGLLELNRH